MAVLVALVVGLVVGLTARSARAHTIGLSTGEYTVRGASVVATLAFARGEVAALVPGLDVNHDGHLTASELDAGRGVLRDKVIGRIRVRTAAEGGASDAGDGALCAAVLTSAALTEEDGLLLAGRWDCARDDQPFEVELALLDDVARGHRHVARSARRDGTHDEVLFGRKRSFTLEAERARAGTSEGTSEGHAADPGAGLWAFFKMGIEHIVTGYDHLAFILGLVLVRARVRSLLVVLTAFTVAHSITLALAVLDVWAPSPRVIEPAIALSIVYVGIENLFVKTAERRWRLTFPFGLVHGFGFAGALREVALPRASIAGALFSFNLGVEAGQIAVLAILLPLIAFLRGKPWFEPYGLRLVSGAVALAGAVWFVSRVITG